MPSGKVMWKPLQGSAATMSQAGLQARAGSPDPLRGTRHVSVGFLPPRPSQAPPSERQSVWYLCTRGGIPHPSPWAPGASSSPSTLPGLTCRTPNLACRKSGARRVHGILALPLHFHLEEEMRLLTCMCVFSSNIHTEQTVTERLLSVRDSLTLCVQYIRIFSAS